MVFAQTSPPDIITTRLTLDEYRAMEETNPERHEYRNGEVITMSGGSESHSAIASNFLITLGFICTFKSQISPEVLTDSLETDYIGFCCRFRGMTNNYRSNLWCRCR
ncbi:Uma2 family endonuclease [Nostoc sp. C052]|uniref:Uma2 family endonuclease n=1 Tax=Nostoc sp. C052 TaxID=2576902 RepID=UPI0021184A9F|nr:Uma2 family endonuclease [Nostoc sp. C052]